MKLYIAGPMSGLPDFNYPAFFAAEEQLKAAGYEAENPARNELPAERADEPMWRTFMRMSLVQISRVDGLALLPGWGDSKGARLEQEIGLKLGLHVRYLEVWLQPEMIADVAAHAEEAADRVLCPECVQGKAVNCAGQALHPDTDELVACGSVR